VSWTLIKKEEYPSFIKGMLAMSIICFWIWFLHPTKTEKTEARSLSFAIACVQEEKLLTSILTEDILDSEPVKPKTVNPEDNPKDEPKDDSKDEQIDKTGNWGYKGDKTDTTTTYTPTTKKEPEIDYGSDGGIIVDGVDSIVDTIEGDIISNGIIVSINGTTTVTPTTERESDIINTTTTTEESQNIDNGTLQVRIIRI